MLYNYYNNMVIAIVMIYRLLEVFLNIKRKDSRIENKLLQIFFIRQNKNLVKSPTKNGELLYISERNEPF